MALLAFLASYVSWRYVLVVRLMVERFLIGQKEATAIPDYLHYKYPESMPRSDQSSPHQHPKTENFCQNLHLDDNSESFQSLFKLGT